jgi:hypothetical protein
MLQVVISFFLSSTLMNSCSLETPSYLKRSHDLDSAFVFSRAVRHAAPAEPAFLGIQEDRGFPFFRTAYKGVTHADVYASSTPVTGIFVKVNMLECHL